MTTADAARVRRRFLILTATRWLPTGLLIPVLIILMQERGLSLATIGFVSAVGSLVVVLLELPTGGLADAIGRRPVLLAAGIASLASMSVLAFAESASLFFLAWTIEGVYRALDSGPLEAWYVDAAQSADPDADIESGLAAQSAVLSGALAVGTIAGGALALVPVPAALPALALPVLVAIVLRACDLTAVWFLLAEAGRSTARPAGGRVRAAVRSAGDAKRTVREALGLLRTSHALLALAAIELLWGAGMSGVEILSGPRMVDLVGGTDAGVLAYALTAAVAWSISGLGAAAAPWVARRTGSWVNAAIVMRVAQAAGVSLAVVVAGPAGLILGYLGFYLVHGGANVAHYGLVHRHVSAAHRSTMVSVNSLTSRIGGVLSPPVLGLLAAGAGMPAAFALAAFLLLIPAPLYLLAKTGPSVRDPAPAAAPST